MNPAVAIALVGFSLGLIAGCTVRWGVGPAASRADERLAQPDIDDDLMAVAAAAGVYGVEEPIPYMPVEFPIAEAAESWLRTHEAQS